MKKIISLAIAAALIAPAALTSSAMAAPIARVGTPEAAISSMVFVPAGLYDSAYVAGITPGAPGQPLPVGTEAQTFDVLTKIKKMLNDKGMDMGDIVMLRVFLNPDPDKGGTADRAGMGNAYKKFFGTAEQPNKPSRTTIQVPPGGPGRFVEIDAIAMKAKK
jgi:enamine deaminase RidA (YjgF/YER057c/UK114 family)